MRLHLLQRHSAAQFLLAGLIAFVAFGCANESPSAVDTIDTAPPTSEPDQRDTADPAEADSPVVPDLDGAIVRTDDNETRNDRFVSPVFDAMGFDPNDRQDAERQYIANAEELVRSCMADAGFDYVANTEVFSPDIGPTLARQLELSAAVSAEQFAAEYGYGITTLTELDFGVVAVDLFVELLFGPATDESRTPTEQAAYETALTGQTIQGLTARQARDQAFRTNLFQGLPGSCRTIGYETAENPVGDKFDGLFSLLGDEFDAIEEEVLNDPRVRELQTTWQTCMAGHGYSYETPDDIRDELFASDRQLRARFLESQQVLDLFALAETDALVSMNSEDRLEWLERNGAYEGFSMVPSLQADLDELIVFELAVASQDEACADDDIFFEVLMEYEQAFVEEHAAQLELIRAGEG